ncbi:MAG: UDP-N-acetylmuramoyl-L-alanine--D-glutamate ligase [Spirochaetes bacterium]|nr:UDP-N-acetylmuramoyl-L-alanine--D-glutamate ligase [Spirochaetota bacterium]
MKKSLMDSYLSKIKNKKILIQGLGINGGGVGSALFFLQNGFDITITDLKKSDELFSSIEQLASFKHKIKYILGEHREIDFKETDIVVKGPGIPPTNKYIKIAEKNNAYITSDIEIFFKITCCPVYAVTGTKGKSTTVSAIYHILRQKTNNAFLGGNITISPLSFYKNLDKDSHVILELSSWQLRDLKNKNFHFDGCAITNLLKDHQNYYSSMQKYLADKLIITQNQTKDNFCILPYKDKLINTDFVNTNAKVYFFSKNDKNSNFYYDNNWACFKDKNNMSKMFSSENIIIHGEHMKMNLLIAASFCKLMGIEKKYILQGIKSFKGAPFRMELVRIWNDIKFFNDTTATIPDAACNAILSFKEPVIWIAGGNDKKLDFTMIKKVSSVPKKILLLTGDGTKKMKKYIEREDIIESDSLVYLLQKAVEIAEKNDVILLSPGCASFGLFQNEFHRGEVFNKFVKAL